MDWTDFSDYFGVFAAFLAFGAMLLQFLLGKNTLPGLATLMTIAQVVLALASLVFAFLTIHRMVDGDFHGILGSVLFVIVLVVIGLSLFLIASVVIQECRDRKQVKSQAVGPTWSQSVPPSSGGTRGSQASGMGNNRA